MKEERRLEAIEARKGTPRPSDQSPPEIRWVAEPSPRPPKKRP
jgi:hypothetical protein